MHPRSFRTPIVLASCIILIGFVFAMASVAPSPIVLSTVLPGSPIPITVPPVIHIWTPIPTVTPTPTITPTRAPYLSPTPSPHPAASGDYDWEAVGDSYPHCDYCIYGFPVHTPEGI